MIFRQEGFQVPGRFPRLFLIRENPAIAPRGAQNPCSPSSHLVCCGNASFVAIYGWSGHRDAHGCFSSRAARPFSRSIIIFLVRPCLNGWVPFTRVHLGQRAGRPAKGRSHNTQHQTRQKRRTTDAGPRTTAPRNTSIPTTTEQLQLLGRRPHGRLLLFRDLAAS